MPTPTSPPGSPAPNDVTRDLPALWPAGRGPRPSHADVTLDHRSLSGERFPAVAASAPAAARSGAPAWLVAGTVAAAVCGGFVTGYVLGRGDAARAGAVRG